MNQPLQFKALINFVIFVALALACFALSPAGLAQLPSPTPDGGYPNRNTAEGTNALFNLTGGANNTALGYRALFKNTVGNDNTATGYLALRTNRSGGANTADGNFALLNNTIGNNNTATGLSALANNSTGNSNTATGFDALFSNTMANSNTAVGYQALSSTTVGSENVALGASALAKNTGFQNIAVGIEAGSLLTTGSGNIDIGNGGVAGESQTIRIGTNQTATFIAGIRGVTTTNMDAVPVVIDSAGQLGTTSSSARFKADIKAMEKSSEAILALRPVTFHYKEDDQATPQFGLVAEEVAKVNPDLVVRNEDGQIYTVRYDAVNAMLLNEFLKEHHTVTELKDLAQKQQAMIAQQQKQIEALTAGLQKVGAAVAAQARELRTAAAQP